MTTLIFALRNDGQEKELLPDELSSSIQVTPESVTINGREVLRAEAGLWVVVDENSDIDRPYRTLDVYL